MILKESEQYLIQLGKCKSESEVFNTVINQMCILEKQHEKQIPKITLSEVNKVLHTSNTTTRPLGPRVYHPDSEQGQKDSIVYSEGHGFSEINASINIIFIDKVSVLSTGKRYFIYGPSATSTVTPLLCSTNSEYNVLCVQLFHKIYGGSIVRQSPRGRPDNKQNHNPRGLGSQLIASATNSNNNVRAFTTKSGHNSVTPFYITINDNAISYNVYFSSRK